MAYKEARKIKNMDAEKISNRVKQMVKLREEYIRNGIENTHVVLQPGNSKTGKKCWTTSLIPIADCHNCKGCWKECYDILNVCFQPLVQNDRARNSAIHKVNPALYWEQVDEQVKAKKATELRVNVGGDSNYTDFVHIGKLGLENSECDILFFTKEYEDLNRYIDEHIAEYPDNYGFPHNVTPLISRWPGVTCNNPYNVPESHVLYADGSTTAPISNELRSKIDLLVTMPETEGRMKLLLDIIVMMREEGMYYCGGNCSECHFNKEGCWRLKKGEHVIFPAH